MKFIKKIIGNAYYFLRFYRLLLQELGLNKKFRLRVLIYHDIPPDKVLVFEDQLLWLSKSWKFITPNEFSAVMKGKIKLTQDSILLTFDDGFLSNLHVAKNILSRHSIKAIFFVITDFLFIKNREESHRFILNNICPELHESEIPYHWVNMQFSDLKSLLNDGHMIGAHTLTHACLSSISKSAARLEIVQGADTLERVLGIQIEHFAFTFGNLDSFNASSLNEAVKRFEFIYTGLRGNNTHRTKSWAIRRDAVTPDDDVHYLGALLEGCVDSLYTSDIKKYESWIDI
jgi:peptidoglycan/xylan/chitin deacetylase (PgdA/CDA1 family)